MGVRRALELTEKELASVSSRSPEGTDAGFPAGVYSLGPLIHNPRVLERLAGLGLGLLDPERLPDDLSGSVVIIRAHGVSPGVEEEILKRGGRVLDATCPRVKTSQTKARSLAGQGFRVFLAGEACHAETAGIRGYAPSCIVVENPPAAEAAAEELYAREPGARTALLGQTTISPKEYAAIEEGIRKRFPDLVMDNTICGATRERQNALRALASGSGALVICGGRESANTRRLLAIAKAMEKPAWLAEEAGDLPAEVFSFQRVGIAAGASTPGEVVDEIEKALLSGSSEYPEAGRFQS
jgi:4-hydroxy-3-methylbut-2-enyl diphosphate reductase